MSNFIKRSKHPITEQFEDAEWLDDHFGKHIYGVRFPSDGKVFNTEFFKIETEGEIQEFGHIKLVDDLKSLLADAEAYKFHDFKNEEHAFPKRELMKRIQVIQTNIAQGVYDN